MRRLLIAAFITLAAATAQAQGLGYAVVGPATTMGFVHHSRITFNAAGGGEVFLAKDVAVGGDLGFFNRLIIASADAAFHVGDDSARVRPFITAGYSRMGIGDGEGAFNGFNVGGGANVWIGDHAGIRFELRDHVRAHDRGTTHYWTARAGIVFR